MKKSVQRCTALTSSRGSYSGQLLATLCLTFILSPSAFSTGIYKWTDEEGKVHYGSQRPEDSQAEKMQLHVPEPASPPDAQQEAEDENQETDPKKEAKLKDGGDQEKANKEREAYCTNERKRLQTVEKNKEIHEKDANGKVSKMNSDARNQRLNKIRANISKYCN